jgi:hypothetical protein
MDPFDPRIALITGIGAAIVSSHRVRAVIGRSAGYVAAGAMKVGSAVADSGRDIYDEARMTAAHENAGTKPKSRPKTAAKTAS